MQDKPKSQSSEKNLAKVNDLAFMVFYMQYKRKKRKEAQQA